MLVGSPILEEIGEAEEALKIFNCLGCRSLSNSSHINDQKQDLIDMTFTFFYHWHRDKVLKEIRQDLPDVSDINKSKDVSNVSYDKCA